MNVLFVSSSVFLGDSQTFLGILATIVVLCVLLNDSNFIHNILVSIKKQVFSSVESILASNRDEADRRVNKLMEMTSLYNDYLMLKTEKGELTLKGAKILQNIFFIRTNIINESLWLSEKYKKIFDFLSIKEEESFAPLYVFFYCIVVFVVDEFIHNGIVKPSNALAFLFLFTSVSAVLGFFVWGYYWYRTKQHVVESNNETIRPVKKTPMKERLSNLGLNVLLFAAIWIVVVLIDYFFNCMTVDSFIWLFSLSIVIPTCVLGLKFCRNFELKYANYRSTFVFSHFAYVLSLSVTYFSLIYFAKYASVPYFSDLAALDYFDNKVLFVKALVFSFVMINGLLFPFCFPFYRYRTYWSNANKETEVKSSEYERWISTISVDIDKFQDEVTSYNESSKSSTLPTLTGKKPEIFATSISQEKEQTKVPRTVQPSNQKKVKKGKKHR